MYTDFNMLQVKVPLIFFGTPVFSARRDGRYIRKCGAREEKVTKGLETSEE